MSEETNLRAKARECVESQRIPNRSPDRLYGGKGTGAECVICCEPVGPDQVEFEIEFDRDGPGSGADKYPAHLACLSAWEFERSKKPGGVLPGISGGQDEDGVPGDISDPVLKWRAS
jgi:hypothetical protein